MNQTAALNWAKDLGSDYPKHSFRAVLLSERVYLCPVTKRLRKLHTEGVFGVEMDGVPYAYPPTPQP